MKELTIRGAPKGTSGFYANAATKITTYNGCIYVAYLDSDRFICVQKKDVHGVLSETRIFGPVLNDQWHMAPVIGVDGNGYVHVTGGMHYGNAFREKDPQTGELKLRPYKGEWNYFISERPEDITGFTEQTPEMPGCPPGWLATYPELFRSNKGDLYLTSRQGSYKPPFLGGAIARYNHNATRWTALGEEKTHPIRSRKKPVYAQWFEPVKGEPTCYQKWCSWIQFDEQNTLHLAWKVNALGPQRNWGTGTHIMYARRKDGAPGWETLNGRPIPDAALTVHNATVVETDLETPELSLNGLAVGTDGSPVLSITYTKNNPPPNRDRAGRPVKWNGESWERVSFPEGFAPRAHYRVMSDNADGMFAMGNPASPCYYSSNNGTTWEAITIPYTRQGASLADLDFQHFLKTGNPRISVFFEEEGIIEVWTIRTKP
ncbi:MAG: hypothetical protein HN742_22765 [Lentisphaerae bacterium]|nr:hypothetical protein [Lentisphaerota bacterium]MBT5612513.1 hypothetical protein [Lentisphaerota bacterium]MBT7844718.1 hypothetical protein [Lentisphaerota bacterium]